MADRWWMTFVVAISARAIYFVGTVFGLVVFVLLNVPLWVFEMEFWACAAALGVFVALVGPPLYTRHKNRGRGTLADVREKSRPQVLCLGDEDGDGVWKV